MVMWKLQLVVITLRGKMVVALTVAKLQCTYEIASSIHKGIILS